MPVVFPNPDIVFDKWLLNVDNKILKKRYKNFLTKSTSISAAETVKSTETAFFALIQIQERPASVVTHKKEEIHPVSDIKRKDPYWEFTGTVEKEEWSGKSFVKMWRSLQPYKCPECQGGGYNSCDCANGFITCKTCKGKLKINCNDCNGKGRYQESVEIKNGVTGKSRHEEINITCQTCFGDCSYPCPNCGGQGKLVHSCNGTGREKCRYCKGAGELFNLTMEPVPIRQVIRDKYFTDYDEKKNDHKVIISALKEKKFSLPRKEVKDPNKLNVKDLNDFLEEIPKNAEKFIKNLHKRLKKFNKDENETIKPPVMLYAGLKLNCKTSKGHKFEILSIGDDQDFTIIDINWI
jgi:hypothetical protein